MNRADIIEAGTRFNKWVVIDLEGYGKKGAVYNCECDCGFVQPVVRVDLVSGRAMQCNRCAIKVRKAKFNIHPKGKA